MTSSYDRFITFQTAIKAGITTATSLQVIDGNLRVDKTVSTKKYDLYYVSCERVDTDLAGSSKKPIVDLGADLIVEIGYAGDCENPEKRNDVVSKGLLDLRDYIVSVNDNFGSTCKEWSFRQGYQIQISGKLAIGYCQLNVRFLPPS